MAITELRNDTFYAEISLSVNGKQMKIDARPSDAIALAVRAEVPVYVDEDVDDAGRHHARARPRNRLRPGAGRMRRASRPRRMPSRISWKSSI